MALREEFESSGNWCFRWRSYLPLILLGVILIGIKDYNPFKSRLINAGWELLCFAISLFGLAIRIATVGCAPQGTSGRNTQSQVADTLNTTGMYSIVRHPLYLGNFFIWLGISMFIATWWVSLIIILVFMLYYERIMFAEEEFLRKKFGDEFIAWADATPAFFPEFKNWKPPVLRFSLLNVLRREYSGFFGIIVSFTFLEFAEDYMACGKVCYKSFWGVVFLGGLAVYLLLRTFKRNTKLLDVEGR